MGKLETMEYRRDAAVGTTAVVNSHNEWDPLEETIVGRIDDAVVPEWHVTLESTMPESSWSFFRRHGGERFPQDMLDRAREEIEGFVALLEQAGVTVRRPAAVDQTVPFATPHFRARGSLYSAMPRDAFLVVGDDIIEAPMAWRNRYFEAHAFRPLLKDYFRRGARWTAAPKPELSDEAYSAEFRHPTSMADMVYAVSEFEPLFDAADFARCGRDLFAQRSNVTNAMGIAWLQRHLGEGYRVHTLEVNDTHPMHIDATFTPLAPGKVLINPERIERLPALFDGWERLIAPTPSLELGGFSMCSNWIVANTFMLDEKRVFVEASEEGLLRAFERWGFEPIPHSLINFNRFGGGFHCCTLDVRRRGGLESYCD
jgi:glycine amidinotransferase